MRRLLVVFVVASLWVQGATFLAAADGNASRCGSPESAGEGGSAPPRLVEIFPNPVADEDVGEFVTVRIPGGGSTRNRSLSDGEATVPLPNVTRLENESATGVTTVTLTNAPNRVPDDVTGSIRQVPGGFALANGGDVVRLRIANRTVDCVSYTDAPEGSVITVPPRGQSPTWEPLGTTDFDVSTAGPGRVRAFLLPDAPGVPIETLRAADRRLYLAAYTLTSRRVASALLAAEDRGVDVRVLVDRDPVGGMSEREAAILDELAAAGVQISTLGGEGARYDFHHAKYAVVDGRALVTTENWKPAGTGGQSSRGWGVVTSQPAIVRRLLAVFRADADWRGTEPWRAVRGDVETEPADSAGGGSGPARFAGGTDPERLPVEGAKLLVAPDNAEGAVVEAIDAANESIDVIQMSVGSSGQPFVRALRRAARRGVAVRLLLSSAWYVEDDNRQLVQALRSMAADRSLPLAVRLAEPRGRFEKVHAKGVVVDGETAVLGSLNWNNHSTRKNREVALLLEGRAVASYFQESFEADWRATATRVPVGLLLVLAIVALLVLRRGWQIDFHRPMGVGAASDRRGGRAGTTGTRGQPVGGGPPIGGRRRDDVGGRRRGRRSRETGQRRSRAGLRPPRERPRRSRGPRRSRRRPSSRRGRR